jgi:hypothetical protein
MALTSWRLIYFFDETHLSVICSTNISHSLCVHVLCLLVIFSVDLSVVLVFPTTALVWTSFLTVRKVFRTIKQNEISFARNNFDKVFWSNL